MSDIAGATEPTDPPVVEEPDGGVPPETPADEGEFKLHPSWERAMEQVPSILRGPLVKQIQESEREHQKAIETARGTDIDPGFRELAQQARSNGISADDLVTSYNNGLSLQDQLATDPFGFLDGLTEQIQGLVKSGQISPRQGAAAVAAGREQAQDTLNEMTDEQREIAELKARLDRQDQQQVQAQTYAQQQAEQQAQEEYGNAFVGAVNQAFDSDPALKDANQQTRWAVGSLAGSLMDADPTGEMTFGQAIGQAMQQLRQATTLLGGGGAPAQQRATQGLPIGGGNGQQIPQGGRPGGFIDDDDARNQMLLDAARSMGITPK